MNTITISIEGMSCNHCVSSVTAAISALPGVTHTSVSLEDKNAAVTFDGSLVTQQKIIDTIEEIGFTVTD